jgi:lipopolysaccharide export system permease protein
MSSTELREFIEEVKRGGGNPDRWTTDLYLKFAFPFANFIIVLIGASLAANKRRSGAAVGFGISVLVCFLYFGLIKMGQSLGYTGTVPPVVAAWFGNFVFFVVGLTMLLRTRT